MRWLWVCVVLVAGCKKEAAAPAGNRGSGGPVVAVPGDATLGDTASATASEDAAGDAGPAELVDLFATVPATLRVSSQVRNRKILPRHLVDRDLKTAWNSVTGELAGAWVDITLAPGTHIHELRLTVGHTGKGPRGQDYFTMNPRIVKLLVAPDGKPSYPVSLDPDSRELQVVPVAAGTHVRITVTEYKPGSKKTWREIAISELQAWGTPPLDLVRPTRPLTPDVFVGEERELPASFCDDQDLQRRREEREASRQASDEKCKELPTAEERDQCMVDPPGDPACLSDEVTVGTVAAPWKRPTVQCMTDDNVYGPTNCTVDVHTVSGDSVQAIEEDIPHAVIDLNVTAVMTSELAGGPPAELEIHYKDRNDTEMIVVCRAKPTLACTAPIEASAAVGAPLIFK